MNSEPQSARDVFLQAIENVAPEKWSAYLEFVCRDDKALREKVERLLEAHQATSFMAGPAGAVAFPNAESASSANEGQVGSYVGAYHLIKQIGEGGMGVVYVAQQSEPISRKVALKVIKPGMDSKQVVARFEAERQALALMNHPNIAKVLDAGATESGRPFFVMEFVEGDHITEFCDKHQLSTRERLKLFATVCHTVQHAHQKGVIHRDLKPSNVLVEMIDTSNLNDNAPVPRIIDFGVAKAIGFSLGNLSVDTELGQFVGTPMYMSPEQTDQFGVDVDTRSDVYSLGVLLYEILTGTTPFELGTLQKGGFLEFQRVIREVEPIPPSARVSTLEAGKLSTVSEHRKADHRRLSQLLRGELDWIVLKALEKDRARRYESASQFAADIQRYLDDQPVLACPPSTMYRLKKIGRRHKGAIFASTLVMLALAIGIIGLAWGLIEANQGRSLAELREKEAEKSGREARAAEKQARESELDTKAFSQFLVNDILSAARPEGLRGGLGVDVTVRQALEAAEAKICEAFVDRPRAEAVARHDLGVTFRLLGERQKAEAQLRRALDLRRNSLGLDHKETLGSQNSLAVLLSALGNEMEAMQLHEQIVKLSKANSSWEDDPDSVIYTINLATTYLKIGEKERAISLFEEVHQFLMRNSPEVPSDSLLQAKANLGRAYIGVGKNDEGIALLEESFNACEKNAGRNNPDTLAHMVSLAAGYQEIGNWEEAMRLTKEAFDSREIVLGANHPDTLSTQFGLGVIYFSARQFTEALRIFKKNNSLRAQVLGAESRETLESMNEMGMCLSELKKYDNAKTIFEDLLPITKRVLGADHIFTARIKHNLARQNLNLRNYDVAIQEASEALDVFRSNLPLMEDRFQSALELIAITHGFNGKKDQEIQIRIDLLNHLALQPKMASLHARQAGLIAFELKNLGRFEESEKYCWIGVDYNRETSGEETVQYHSSLTALGFSLVGQEKYDEAEPIVRKVRDYRRRTIPDHYTSYNDDYGLIQLRQAKVLALTDLVAAQKKFDEAEAELTNNYEQLKKRESEILKASRPPVFGRAINRIIELYEAMDRPDEVTKWKKVLLETATEIPN